MDEVKFWLGPMRLPFLILAPACALVGVGTAVWAHGGVRALDLILALVGAIVAHISVNALNEYYDFKSGLDSRTVRTPFSGGSGTLQARPEMAKAGLIIGLASLAVTALIGLYFLSQRGWGLLPIGIIGILVIVAYTPLITRSPILCLISPGLGFGPLMVMGTHFCLTGEYTWTAFIASLVPFFLVNDLLLLNQFPDAQADETVGRRHLPISAGKRTSSIVYGLFLLGTYLSILVGVGLQLLPLWALLGLTTLLLAVPVAIGVYRNAESGEGLVPFMGQNVILNIATPVLLAFGLFIA